MDPLNLIPDQLPGLIGLVLHSTGAVASRYFLLAGIAWLLCYVWMKRRWIHRKVIARFPPASQVRREAFYSASSMAIFGVVGGLTLLAGRHGWTWMYWKVSERGWGWFGASIALCILLHDAYFYWTHRLMHHRKLFKLVHHIHHTSTNPSPWAAYSFSPLEALVQAGIFPLAACVMPLHPIAFTLFMGWQVVFNVLGHAGYEFHPRWLMDSPLRFILNTPTNHVLHHEKFRGNYGIYFNVWDRLLGTNHEAYEDRFREVTSRPPEPRATETAKAASTAG